jgi:ribosome-associated protein
MDVRVLSSVTDFFVICTADSHRQFDAIKDHVEAKLAEAGGSVWHVEGAASPLLRVAKQRVGDTSPRTGHEPQWLLMDCGDIVVHLLDQETRSFYRLEELWADAPRLPVESVTRYPA